MTIHHTELADFGDRIRGSERINDGARHLTMQIQQGELEVYREHIVRWRVTDVDGIRVLDDQGVHVAEADAFIDAPQYRTRGVPMLFSWLRAQGLGPFATTTTITTEEPAVTYLPVDQMITLTVYAERRMIAPAQMEPWRKTFIRYVNTVGRERSYMDDGWLTAPLEGPGRVHSSLERMMEEPWEMPSTLPAFGRWLRDNGQTAPDAVEGTVPSGDTVAVPIGPDHPDWDGFWQRAREAAGPGYVHYWETLANAMGYVPPVVNERIWVDLVYRVEVEAPAGSSAHDASLIAQRQFMQSIRDGRTVNRQTQSIAQRRPLR